MKSLNDCYRSTNFKFNNRWKKSATHVPFHLIKSGTNHISRVNSFTDFQDIILMVLSIVLIGNHNSLKQKKKKSMQIVVFLIVIFLFNNRLFVWVIRKFSIQLISKNLLCALETVKPIIRYEHWCNTQWAEAQISINNQIKVSIADQKIKNKH